MRTRMRLAARMASVIGGIVIGSLLAACGPTAAATSQISSPTAIATATAQPTATSLPTATATPLGANPCGSSSTAGTADLLSAWHIPTPAGAIVVDQGNMASDGPDGGATYTLIGVCAKGSTPDGVWAFYAAHMPASGWTQSATVPAIGGSTGPCGYKYCWTKDVGQGKGTIVTLKNLQMKGSDTEFTIVDENIG